MVDEGVRGSERNEICILVTTDNPIEEVLIDKYIASMPPFHTLYLWTKSKE